MTYFRLLKSFLFREPDEYQTPEAMRPREDPPIPRGRMTFRGDGRRLVKDPGLGNILSVTISSPKPLRRDQMPSCAFCWAVRANSIAKNACS